jgi:hypothetical protein
MTGSPADNPNEFQIGPSGPKLIDIDEIVGLDNFETATPQAGSPRGVSTQPKTVRTSGRESVSNPLSELINIYDDEERREVSLVTPVQITEEKELEKTPSPALNSQIWDLPQNEQEVESVLDTNLPDAPETQAGSPKDVSRSGEEKEETPHQEIDISADDNQVSTKPTPDASISISTQIPNQL